MQASTALKEPRLPRQIIRQSEAIKARLAEQAEPKTEPITESTPPAEPAVPVVTTVETTQPPSQPSPSADPRESDPAYWKQRYKVTDGILRKTREEMNRNAEEFNRQLVEMQGQIRSLQVAAPQPQADLSTFFTSEQIEDLGEPQARAILDTVMKAAGKHVQDAVEAHVKPLRDKQVRDEQQAAVNARVSFENQLTELVPNYSEIDESEGWHLWLADEDEATGIQRQEILTRHVNSGNASKVAKMFKDFESTLQPPARPQPPVAPHGTAATVSAGPHISATAPARRPSKSEITEFYKRAALNKVSAQERAAFEASLKLPS